MSAMNKIDHLDIDGHLLRLLLAVYETGSITRAAERLGVTQSAVSHLLDKLRRIVGDPLFVKSGRGIAATTRAEALAEEARRLLNELQRFAHTEQFDPTQISTPVVIAANDLQRDLLLPALFARLQQEAPQLQLHILPSAVPSLELLRSEHCHLVISPRPPEGTDIVHKRLFTDRYRVFFDASSRDAPQTLSDYISAEHVSVAYESPRRGLDIDQHLSEQGIARRLSVTVPGFAGIPAFLRGSRRLATLPGRLEVGLLRGLAHCEPPFPCPAMPMYAIWHIRNQHDAKHRWLRQRLNDAVISLSLNDQPDPH